MVTLCWAAKGGSGTTVVAAALAISSPTPVLLVDLDGELPLTLGIAEPDRPGVADWLASDAPAAHLDDLLVRVDEHLDLLPWRGGASPPRRDPTTSPPDAARQRRLVEWLASWAPAMPATVPIERGSPPRPLIRRRRTAGHDHRTAALAEPDPFAAPPGRVVIDAGTGEPWPLLTAAADHRLLVTRRCYLAIRRAARLLAEPTGVVLVDEPFRGLSNGAIEATMAAPIVASVSYDPAVARAVDVGLLVARLPSGVRRALRGVA
jgi:hypothetical protein